MGDSKVIAIYVIASFAAVAIAAYSSNYSDAEKERTKQMEIQWKIDSLKHIESTKSGL